MMKCDELKRKYSDITGPYYGYNEVNEAIEELKTEHHKERHEYIKMVAELKEERRWRKFPDEKPTEDIKFLVINEKGFMQCCYYSPILHEFQIPVTHWMPLPSAPKEADK